MHNLQTVLIVDDASLVRLYYRSILEPAGFRVEEAFNGLEALEKLPSVAPDLLIVDVNMPQMDGFTFIDTVRRLDSPLASIPTLITSTESQEEDFAAARIAGANHYLVKPIEREKLVEYASLLCGLAR
jgi:two-component system, chemotaxis family, chemotaxis protein CheY